jgi:outer membrane protein TolC
MLNSGNAGMAPSAPQKNQQAQETGNGSNVLTQQSSETKTQNPPLPPESLNPSANPLLFPTKPEEVQIQNFQRITLEQAIILARRNNRDLQVALLTAERSRAALREALAAEYPNIGVEANFTRSDSASAELSNARQRPLLGDDNILPRQALTPGLKSAMTSLRLVDEERVSKQQNNRPVSIN